MLINYKFYFKYATQILFAGLVFFLALIPNAQADSPGISLIARTEWQADESLLSSETSLFVQVKEIKIIRLPVVTHNAYEYVQGLYFYVATTFGEDVPFHYLISGKGDIYEGASGGFGVQLQKHVSNGILTIGYIPDSMDPLSLMGRQSLTKLLLYLHAQTGIGIGNINAYGYIFDGVLNNQNPEDSWKNSIESIKSSFNKAIPLNNQDITYTINLSNAQITKSQDGNYLISMDIANRSEQPLYGRIYIGTDSPSPLYFVGHWLSNERSVPQDIANIAANKHVTFNFEIAKSPPNGEYNLSFYTDSNKILGDMLQVSVPKDRSAISVRVVRQNSKNN